MKQLNISLEWYMACIFAIVSCCCCKHPQMS